MFYNIYKKKSNITLLIHKNPDGDALGSSLALMIYFKKLKKKHNVNLISPTEYPEYFSWLPYIEDIIIFSKKTEYIIQKKILNSDYIFFIDFNNISRIGDISKFLLETKSKKILIDHHPYNYNNDYYFSNKILHDSVASSASIIVYKFISETMNDINKLDNNIATCLYLGLLTDTGFFRFPSVNYETHFIAEKLIKKGANISQIYKSLQENYDENKLKLLSKALYKLKILKKYRTTYTSINESDICNIYKKGDVDGIINYGLNIKNIIFSVFFFEEKKKNPIKISFRSKGNFDVNLFARKHFYGGGHKNAAGGILYKDLPESINYFLNIIPSYYDCLNSSI